MFTKSLPVNINETFLNMLPNAALFFKYVGGGGGGRGGREYCLNFINDKSLNAKCIFLFSISVSVYLVSLQFWTIGGIMLDLNKQI